jgi:hypothetical protein
MAADLFEGSTGIMALLRGEESESARAAAVLVADGLRALRVIAGFCEGVAKGASRRG